jgi:hypothetical protein
MKRPVPPGCRSAVGCDWPVTLAPALSGRPSATALFDSAKTELDSGHYEVAVDLSRIVLETWERKLGCAGPKPAECITKLIGDSLRWQAYDLRRNFITKLWITVKDFTNNFDHFTDPTNPQATDRTDLPPSANFRDARLVWMLVNLLCEYPGAYGFDDHHGVVTHPSSLTKL